MTTTPHPEVRTDAGPSHLVRLQPPSPAPLHGSGRYLATAQAARLTVRDLETQEVVTHFSCVDAVETVTWSPDSELVSCGVYKRSLVQVFAVHQPECEYTASAPRTLLLVHGSGRAVAAAAKANRPLITTTLQGGAR